MEFIGDIEASSTFTTNFFATPLQDQTIVYGYSQEKYNINLEKIVNKYLKLRWISFVSFAFRLPLQFKCYNIYFLNNNEFNNGEIVMYR